MPNLRSLFVLAFAAAMSLAGAVVADEKTVVTGIAQPSQKLKLSFAAPGPVRSVDVKEGDRVKTGQVLGQLDHRIEQTLHEAAKLESESRLKVDYAKADKDLKQVQLKRKEEMRADGVASVTELEEARMAVILAETQVALAEQELQLKKLEADRYAIRVEWMRLTSPIDGHVEKIEVGPGETVDPSKPSILVLKTDPLWIELHLTSDQAEQLKLGETLDVRYSENEKWSSAKTIFFAEIDPASATQLVRLELPNPTGRKSGHQVQVQLPQRVAQAGGLIP